MLDLVNMVDGGEQTRSNPIFFLSDTCVNKEKYSIPPFDEYRAFSWKIFMHTLQLLRVSVCIECIILVKKK